MKFTVELDFTGNRKYPSVEKQLVKWLAGELLKSAQGLSKTKVTVSRPKATTEVVKKEKVSGAVAKEDKVEPKKTTVKKKTKSVSI